MDVQAEWRRKLVRVGFASIALSLTLVQGCASIAEGVTRGLVAEDKDKPPRACEVTGPAFQGVSERLRRLELSGPAALTGESSTPNLKVMMVHGIGTHPPGYSARFQRRLTEALGLTRRDEQIKEIDLRAPELFGDEPLGHLRVFRYMNEDQSRKMVFYELSWSEITAEAKATLAYDTSGEYEYRRSDINHAIKVFLNDRMADPMAYFGESNAKIIQSIGTGLCWMTISDWEDLPPHGAPVCDGFEFADPKDFLEDEYVFVTHSLGSRILTDAFQQQAGNVKLLIEQASHIPQIDREQLRELIAVLRSKQIRVYMLANQLPLLELGASPAEVVGQIDDYCSPEGAEYENRFMGKLSIVAFSDPNDALSYALPQGYEDKFMDSRVCPEIINVSVNVVDPINLFGISKLTNPMAAHGAYEDDARVIGLIVDGIGTEDVDATVAAECRWLETVKD